MPATGPQISSVEASRAAGRIQCPVMTIPNARTKCLRGCRRHRTSSRRLDSGSRICKYSHARSCMRLPAGIVASVADRVKEGVRMTKDRASGKSAEPAMAPAAETTEPAEAGGPAEATSLREMMRLVAQLYYVRELGQPEIAALTGFSVSKVSRLLAAPRPDGE